MKSINIEERMRHYEKYHLDDLEYIPEISFYNHNYYIGAYSGSSKTKKDLIYAVSDDDNETVLYLVSDKNFTPFAYCFTSENDKIYVDKNAGM